MCASGRKGQIFEHRLTPGSSLLVRMCTEHKVLMRTCASALKKYRCDCHILLSLYRVPVYSPAAAAAAPHSLYPTYTNKYGKLYAAAAVYHVVQAETYTQSRYP